MTKAEILALAERVEAATTDEQREMLDLAFRAIHGEKPPRIHGGSEEMDRWLRLYNPFFKMLEAKAFESAAMSLVSPDHTIQLSDWEHPVLRERGPWQAIVLPFGKRGKLSGATFDNRCEHAATPALALTAAALKARAMEASNG